MAVACCFGLGALLGWRQIVSPDIGFHLSSARWMLEHRAWPATDPFSFTVTGHPYIDMQWLFQLMLYGANRLGGPGLMIAHEDAGDAGLLGVCSSCARGGSAAFCRGRCRCC